MSGRRRHRSTGAAPARKEAEPLILAQPPPQRHWYMLARAQAPVGGNTADEPPRARPYHRLPGLLGKRVRGLSSTPERVARHALALRGCRCSPCAPRPGSTPPPQLPGEDAQRLRVERAERLRIAGGGRTIAGRPSPPYPRRGHA